MAILTLIAAMIILYAFMREMRMRTSRPKPEASKGFAQKGGGLVETLTDPKDAAAILLVQMAAFRGQVTLAEKNRIQELMASTFGSEVAETEGLFSFGRMAVGQLGDPDQWLRKVLRPIRDSLTLSEMNELIGMMEAVSAVEGLPTNDQQALIMATRRALRLDHTTSMDG